MPVGRTEDQDDGRPLRQYRGKPQPLGVLTEWTCPSCGQKVSGQVYEAGCPHCGVGVPGSQPTPAQQPTQPAAPTDWVQPPASAREAGPLRPKVGRPVEQLPGLVVTRIIQYVCKPGQEAAMEQTLQRALVGRVGFAWGEIIAAIVDDVSVRQQDILGLAKRQPGVWLGGPDKEERYPLMRIDLPDHGGLVEGADALREAVLRFGEMPGRDEAHPGRPFLGKTGMTEPIVPNQGPSYTEMDQKIASAIVHICGVKVAYTLALALQALAAANDDSDPLVLKSAEAYALSNAIMQLIPKDYVEPDLPPPPPPSDTGAGTQARDDARARIRAIQEASKPVATIPE